MIRARTVTTIIIGGAAIAFAWHFALAMFFRYQSAVAKGRRTDATLSINPITDVIHMAVSPPRSAGATSFDAGIAPAIAEALAAPVIERELATDARERFDLYAMIVPYRVRISVDPRLQSTPTDARLSADLDSARAFTSRAPSIQYARAFVRLEQLRVADGSSYGRPTRGVFGTVVNAGQRTLRSVTVRVFFLDANGRRIGEATFHPVLVADFSVGDNTPLRPGYRRDFGYSVSDVAPSGWAGRVQAQVDEIEFST